MIAYKVSAVDKAKTPSAIYFFEDGKVTIIPGEEFGLTLGDFAKMEDKEIWKTYEEVRETYAKTYEEEQKKNLQNNIDMQKNDTGVGEKEYLFAEMQQALDEAIAAGDQEQIEAINKEMEAIEDEFNESSKEGLEELARLEKAQSDFSCAGPFFDLPFSFVIKTDASGNNVQEEKMVYPTLSYTVGGTVPNVFYDSITFANVEGADKQVYDTTYNCFALGTGGSVFCTRDSMRLDTVDSKNVMVDPSSDEVNKLFEKEVTARYK